MMDKDNSADSSMEHLVSELQVLLKLLDHENVSSATSQKMTTVRHLLDQVKPQLNGSEFIYMNTSLYGNGTSFVESLFEEFDCDLQELRISPEEKEQPEDETPKTQPPKSNPQSPVDTPPPLPATPIPEDYYEEAVPLGPGTTPQYITTRNSCSPPNSIEIEDAYYEDADNNYPTTRINDPRQNSYNDSDALSSSYESYDEEDEETKWRSRQQQWPTEESPVGPMKDCHICAFLLRKKRFGQWAKQLTVVRDNRLQCFKSIKDLHPHMELPLNLCNVIYVPKDGRRKKHELRFSLPGGEALVLAVQSKEQAERWLKVIQEVASQASETLEGSSSPMIQRKIELDKLLSADKHTSDSDSAATGDNLSTNQGQGRDTLSSNHGSARENGDQGKANKKGAFSDLTGSMSRAAGKKINRIISFSKKKPPLPGDVPASSHHDNPRCGYLNLLVGVCWKERWCTVRGGTLFLHRDRGDLRTPVSSVCLRGAEVVPGVGPKHPFAFRILAEGNELAALEASCSEEMGRWLGVLLAETGGSILPEALHYDYVDVDTITNIQDAARNSFLWATSSSSTSTDSRTYDEVPYESIQQGAPEPRPNQVKRHSSFSSRDSEKTEPQVTVKRHASSRCPKDETPAVQYKYGKTRAEEDARRFLKEKEQLEREKEEIKQSLNSLRRERKESKDKLKTMTGKQQQAMEQRVSQLEEACRGKEAERVDLELRLTEVKENLKKSLAGGALAPPTDSNQKKPLAHSKPPRKGHVIKVENDYGDAVTTATTPVNCASELKKRPPSVYASSRGNVMQKAKEWESKKGT